MHFKLLVAFVDDNKTDAVLKAARKAGATGATVINNARGEGLNQAKTFFGLSLDTQRDMLLFLVEEHMARQILEKIAQAGEFESTPGSGIAIQIDVEDAVGVTGQVAETSGNRRGRVMNEPELVRVRDVMKTEFDMVDGLATVADASAT